MSLMLNVSKLELLSIYLMINVSKLELSPISLMIVVHHGLNFSSLSNLISIGDGNNSTFQNIIFIGKRHIVSKKRVRFQ